MLAIGLSALVVLLVLYLTVAPVRLEPVAWKAPKNAGYVGPYSTNTRLSALQRISLGGERGPEHVAVGPDGKLYAAVDGGGILRIPLDGSEPTVWARTGGRVLGFDFDARGRLIAADAMRGLLAIESGATAPADRTIDVLVDKVSVDGSDDPIRYANAVMVARNGKIYFTDSTRRFSPALEGGTFNASVLDALEHSSTGRLLVYDPATGQTQVMLSDLSFANGVALSTDERSLFVAETNEYRVWKVAVSVRNLSAKTMSPPGASGAGARILIANLPGFPDNLMRGLNGRIWLGLVKPRVAAVDALADKPFFRKVMLRLPRALWPIPPSYGHVLAFNEEGEVVIDLQDPSGTYPEATGVVETTDGLYVQSLQAPALGWLPKSAAGL